MDQRASLVGQLEDDPNTPGPTPNAIAGIDRCPFKGLGTVYKGRPANGEGWWFRNFGRSRTGEVVCENSDVRKLLTKFKFQFFSELIS